MYMELSGPVFRAMKAATNAVLEWPIVAVSFEYRDTHSEAQSYFKTFEWRKCKPETIAQMLYSGEVTVTIFRRPNDQRPPLVTQLSFFTREFRGEWTLPALVHALQHTKAPKEKFASVVIHAPVDGDGAALQAAQLAALESEACEAARALCDAWAAATLDEATRTAPASDCAPLHQNVQAPTAAQAPAPFGILTRPELTALVYPTYASAQNSGTILNATKTTEAFIDTVLTGPFELGRVPDMLRPGNPVSRKLFSRLTGLGLASTAREAAAVFATWATDGRRLATGQRIQISAAPAPATAPVMEAPQEAQEAPRKPETAPAPVEVPVDVQAPVIGACVDCEAAPAPVHPGQLAKALETGAWIRDAARRKPGFSFAPSTVRVKTRLETLATAGYLAVEWAGDTASVRLLRDW